MESVTFLVQGSRPDPYQVIFKRRDGELIARCSCSAGENGMHCKHRIEILKGNSKFIVSDNPSEILIVMDWLKNTALEIALAAEIEAEAQYKASEKIYSAAKKKLARIMVSPQDKFLLPR